MDPIVDCVDPVAPEDWLKVYTNTIEQACDAPFAPFVLRSIPIG